MVLAEEINQCFCSLTASFVLLSHCDVTSISVQDLPNDLLVTERKVFKAIRLTKSKKIECRSQNLCVRACAGHCSSL